MMKYYYRDESTLQGATGLRKRAHIAVYDGDTLQPLCHCAIKLTNWVLIDDKLPEKTHLCKSCENLIKRKNR
jgi:hypothetical protein